MAIVNPRSGGAFAKQSLEALNRLGQVLRKTVSTEYPGHATELARNSAGYEGLASVGGDGTLFEILQGMDRERQRVAIIAAGRGNSLARDLGLYGAPPCLGTAGGEHAVRIDLLEVHFTKTCGVSEKRISASTVAVGYPALVAWAAGRLARFGRFSYLAAAATVRPVAFTVELSLDRCGTGRKQLRGIVINNTRHMANFLAFPEANCDDGFFDVMELDAGFLGQSLHNCSALSARPLFKSPPATRAQSARVCFEKPQLLMIDGELFPDVVAVSVRIQPSGLACNRRAGRE